MLWQSRPRLARLMLEGLSRRTLLHTILLEGLLLAATGAVTGALLGVYGQHLVDHALAATINFPIHQATTLTPTLTGLALLVVPTLAVLTIPAHLTTRQIVPELALAD